MTTLLAIERDRPAARARIDTHLLLLVAVCALGLALRLYGLGAVPYGFHPDEGHEGADALAILDGWRPAFLPADNGREPLFVSLVAVSVGLFGPTVWAARLVGALGGTLVILAQYLLVRSLPIPRPRLTALVSAALLAVTFWPVAIAHQVQRTGFFPFWTALWLVLLIPMIRFFLDNPAMFTYRADQISVLKPGERVLQTHSLSVARDAPAGPARVRGGWYDWRDGQRLPVAGAADGAVEVGSVGIGAGP